MENALNWFEIPVADMERAAIFYNTILSAEMKPMEMGDSLMTFLPAERGGVGGALVKSEGFKPSTTGTLVYLNGGEDLSRILNKVEAAGGKVTQPKMSIGEYGFIAFFTDSEGNRVGLHSMK